MKLTCLFGSIEQLDGGPTLFKHYIECTYDWSQIYHGIFEKVQIEMKSILEKTEWIQCEFPQSYNKNI